MDETPGVRVVESPRRHAGDHIVIVDEAVVYVAEFEFDIVAEIVQAHTGLAKGVETIEWEQCFGIVRASTACEDGKRTPEAVAGDPQSAARPGASSLKSLADALSPAIPQ